MEDYQHPEIIHSSGHKMELDIYTEPLKLAIEYQGQQHYKPIPHLPRKFEEQQTRDEEKKRACKQVLNRSPTIIHKKGSNME